MSKREVISNRKKQGISSGCMVAFFSIFLIAGLFFFSIFFVFPLARVIKAKSWPSAEATVVSSRVAVSTDSDGTTYRIEMTYDYAVDGVKYQSKRYQLSDVWSSGRKNKQRVVNEHPPGKKVACFYNPSEPGEATIVRRMTGDMWIGLLPLIFVLVGLGGVLGGLGVFSRKSEKPKDERFGHNFPVTGTTSVRTETDSPVPEPDEFIGPVTLKAQSSRLGRFIGVLFAAAFWNGIVGVMVASVVKGFVRGQPNWFLTIFMTPFVLVGLAIIGGAIYTFLQLFNPRVTLTLQRGNARLGDKIGLSWMFQGRTSSIRHLTIHLVAKEFATYQRGTSMTTDDEEFCRVPLVDTTNHFDISGGKETALIPADSMHTFKSDHNEVAWMLEVKGDIAWWPDVDQSFRFDVLPLELEPKWSRDS